MTGVIVINVVHNDWIFLLLFQAQLTAMHAARFHSASKAPSPVYLKGYKEPREDKDSKSNSQSKISKLFSVETLVPESKGQKKRSNSIQEFSESFDKQLRFRTKRSTSLVGELQEGLVGTVHFMKSFLFGALVPACGILCAEYRFPHCM